MSSAPFQVTIQATRLAIKVHGRQILVRSTGLRGFGGWSPVFGLAEDGPRRVLQVIDYVGGSGPKPASGLYVGPDGPVSDITAAVDIGASSTAPVTSVAGRIGAIVLTKGDVDLGNVDNTADLAKPVSTAQAAADAAVASAAAADATTKANAALASANAAAPGLAPVQKVSGRTGDVVLTKTDVGLANVDNTADLAKPVSTAQAAADAAVASAAAADATTKANAALASANAAAPGLAPVQSVAGRNGAVVLTLADLTDSTPAGRALAASLDATAQRVLLGLGNSATRDVGTAAGTVAAGDHTHTPAAVGADPAGTAASAISTHVAASNPHSQYQLASARGAVNGYASLDAGGKIPQGQLPAVAIVEYLGSVASQSAMLALNGQQGDWCVRSDLSTVWVITGSDPTLIGSWTQFIYPASPVLSVAGRTGAITLSSVDISDSTAAGHTILTAADAAAQRTALGLGSAAVRADTDFLRDDVVQSFSTAEIVRLRGNAGFGRGWTVAELTGLSNGDSASLGIAWCSNAIALDRHYMAGNGAWAFWDATESCWRTMRDGVPITADFQLFTLHMGRQNRAGFVGPFGAVFGDIAPGSAVQPLSYPNGSGANPSSAGSDGTLLSQFNATTGSTTSGSVRGAFLPAALYQNTAPIRDIGFAFGFRATSTALSSPGDTWHYRFGFGEAVFNSSATLTSNEAGLVMDDQNTLGMGATGTTLRAYSRVNGVNVDWVDSTLNPSASVVRWFVITWEPTGPGTREGTLKIAMADSRAQSLTPILSRQNLVWGSGMASMQANLLAAKTAGNNLRFLVRKSARVIVRRRDNTVFAGELE